MILRAILCKNQAKWEMKNLTPQSNFFHAIRYCGGMSKKCTLVRLLLYGWHGNAECLLVAPTRKFNSETVVKSAKCIVLFLQNMETLQPKTEYI